MSWLHVDTEVWDVSSSHESANLEILASRYSAGTNTQSFFTGEIAGKGHLATRGVADPSGFYLSGYLTEGAPCRSLTLDELLSLRDKESIIRLVESGKYTG